MNPAWLDTRYFHTSTSRINLQLHSSTNYAMRHHFKRHGNNG